MEDRTYKKYFIGKLKSGQWSSVYAYKPHNYDVRSRRGEIFAVITLTGPESFAVSTAGNLILDNLHEIYFENTDDPPMIALEKAVKASSQYLQKILENDSAADVGIDFDLVTMVILGDIIYFVNLGDNVVKAWRDGRLTELTPVLKDPTGEGIICVGSMIATTGDIFFLTSEQFEKEVGEDSYIELAETFSDTPLKQRVYEEESKISMIMVGYNLDLSNLPKSAETQIDLDKEGYAETYVKSSKVVDVEYDERDMTETEAVKGDDELAIDGKLEMQVEEPLDHFVTEQNEDVYDLDEQEQNGDERGFQQTRERRKVSMPKIGFGSVQPFFAGLLTKVKGIVVTQKKRLPVTEASANYDEDSGGDAEEIERIRPLSKKTLERIDRKKSDTTFIYMLNEMRDKLGIGLRVIWEKWLGMGKGSRNLTGEKRNKRWGFLFIVVIVIGSLIYFSLQDSLKNQKQKEAELNAQKNITIVTTALDQSEKDAKIIAKASVNVERKDAFLKDLATSVKPLDSVRGIKKFTTEVKKLDDRVIYIKDLVNKTINLATPSIIVDRGALNPGSTLSDIAISISNKLVYYADQKYGKIYSIAYDGKNEREIASGLNSPSTIAIDNKSNVLFLDKDTDRRLGFISPDDPTVQRVAGTSASKLGGVTQIEFAIIDAKNKIYRLYAIDPTNKKVYHLESRDGESYGLPSTRSFTLENMDQLKDIAIQDLKIYLLMPVKQGVIRTLQDKDETPEITGLNVGDSFLNASAFFIDDEYIYVADSKSQSVFVINKNTLQFKAKYTYRGSAGYFKDMKDIVADRAAGKIFVLDGSRVIALSMNELANF